MNKDLEIQNLILKAIQKLSLVQQIKLLEFINSLLDKVATTSPNKQRLLQFAGIFEKEDLKEIEEAIEDCEQIDEDEW